MFFFWFCHKALRPLLRATARLVASASLSGQHTEEPRVVVTGVVSFSMDHNNRAAKQDFCKKKAPEGVEKVHVEPATRIKLRRAGLVAPVLEMSRGSGFAIYAGLQ